MRLKFLREGDQGWFVEDKLEPIREGRNRGQGIVAITRDTTPGLLTGIDRVCYQNAYPATAVIYGLYPLRDPDPANLAPMRVGNLIVLHSEWLNISKAL